MKSGIQRVGETGDGYSGVRSPGEQYLFVDGDGRGPCSTTRRAASRSGSTRGLRDFPAGRVRTVSCTPTTRSCTPVGPEFRLPADTFLLFGTGNGPYFA
jgi:hypothetical protein